VAGALLEAGRPEVRFGVLPAGTGNDFARNLDLPISRMEECVRVLAQGHTRWVDAGEIATPSRPALPGKVAAGEAKRRFFINVLGLGFDVGVVDAAADARFLRGEWLYKITAIQQLFRFPGITAGISPLTPTTGANDRQSYLMLTISNGAQFGGGFAIAPEAQLDDGQLHSCVIHNAAPLRRARLFSAATAGKHASLSGVEFHSSSHFAISSPAPIRFEADGDLFEVDGDRLEVSIRQGALQVLAPS
jgi:diacylglycerol kinase (ATP)